MSNQKYPNSPLSDKAFLRLNQVLQLIPIGRSTFWSWVANGKAPAPVKLSQRTTAWRSSDIANFLETLSRDGGE